jgi:excisionase family DNA binding protein
MLATENNTGKRQRPEADGASAEEAAKWFTRPGLAAALGVSVGTVDRMAKSGGLPRVKLRGRVRFYLPDVIGALRKADRKFGRAAEFTAASAKSAEEGAAGVGAGNSQSQIANSR